MVVKIKHSKNNRFESSIVREYCIDELLKLGIHEHEGKLIGELKLSELKTKLSICLAQRE